MNSPNNRIRIFDTSLRDGEQSPGFTMSGAQKIAFAHALAELGVDVIEAGFPNSSPADYSAVQTIARDVRGASIAALARCHEGDIEACARALERAESPRIHVFISSSPLHRQYKLNMSREQVIEHAIMGVTLARKHVDDVEFSAEDAFRTERDFLVELFNAAVATGATTLNVPDTVGYATPDEIRELFRYLRANVQGADGVVFSAHCHNDLGLAVANSLAAIEGGARQVECTINGIGERAGNAALEELVMALKVRQGWYGVDTGITTPKLLDTSRLLSRITGIQVQRNKAIVGLNAFAHESGIHQHGMLKNRDTYEIMHPQDVGWPASQLVLGRHSGRAAVADRLRALGHVLDDAQLDLVIAQAKALTHTQHVVSDADLLRLVAGDHGDTGWRIASMSLIDEGQHTRAHVELSDPDGHRVKQDASGDGPIAALFAALAKAAGVDFELESYEVHSMGIGRDARGEANLSARIGGETFSGQGTSRDVLEASAIAWLEVANRLLRSYAMQRVPAFA
ncbi:2-isopropylmalate synthase [Thermomonas sp. RSS23]|uniref:2-isopropylmalate synthase n=1 Tax=Thermomonas beijingensis TaxID=2872701 RepID=A0ABS7TF23_9GAMM|nr:2-isopropylmalate synthase [Thermomonas beijingensis]MBZ4186446.1 2-isopropylmalate synthase [Thermomonas beijingensis]